MLSHIAAQYPPCIVYVTDRVEYLPLQVGGGEEGKFYVGENVREVLDALRGQRTVPLHHRLKQNPLTPHVQLVQLEELWEVQ